MCATGSACLDREYLGAKEAIETDFRQCRTLAEFLGEVARVAELCLNIQIDFACETTIDYRIKNWEAEPLNTLAIIEGDSITLTGQTALTESFRREATKYDNLMKNKMFKTIALDFAKLETTSYEIETQNQKPLDLNCLFDKIFPMSESKFNGICANLISGDITVEEAQKWSSSNEKEEIGKIFEANKQYEERFSRVNNLLNNWELSKHLQNLAQLFGLKSVNDHRVRMFNVSIFLRESHIYHFCSKAGNMFPERKGFNVVNFAFIIICLII